MKIEININNRYLKGLLAFFRQYSVWIIVVLLATIAFSSFLIYYQNGLGLAYNDARSHLDISRRVVEGLKPGLAQLGSVWLPLLHVLMIPTVWNDFMWHSGLAGASVSMISFIAIGVIIYLFLKNLGVGQLGRWLGVIIFATNLNILYLQSTAMTELLLLMAMMAGVYHLVKWHQNQQLGQLIISAFWIMISTLVRYDGWFLLAYATVLIWIQAGRRLGYKGAEGTVVLFITLGSLGVGLWLLWNLLIFGDPLYFAFGPFSARAQQLQLQQAGELITKGDWWLSTKFYLYALTYNVGAFNVILGTIGAITLWFDRRLSLPVRIATTALFAPLLFNILALYLGHSVLFIQGLSGNTWFNVRYGVMLVPSFAIFIGYLIYRLSSLRWVIIGLIVFVTFFSFTSQDAVTIDDARVGSSQKNVSEVSGWLADNTANKKGFILLSVASHDAIVFSSGLPMKRFIHEGTGRYWEEATGYPDRWARWIILRTYDQNDLTYKLIKDTVGFSRYDLIVKYPFADIYQLKPQYLPNLITEPIFEGQK